MCNGSVVLTKSAFACEVFPCPQRPRLRVLSAISLLPEVCMDVTYANVVKSQLLIFRDSSPGVK